MVRDALVRLKKKSEYLNFGRDILAQWIAAHGHERDHLSILDLGFGLGDDLRNAREALPHQTLDLYGVEYRPSGIDAVAGEPIHTTLVDIERETLPYADAQFDVIIANQIIEHCKEVFWIFAEVSRVLKPGGIAMVGVPNLAAFHNRLALLWGEQPTCIEMRSPHVRGITKPTFERFITTGDYFDVLDVRGANFYPFPPALARPLSRMLPTMAVTIFFLLRRTDKAGTFYEYVETVSPGRPYW